MKTLSTIEMQKTKGGSYGGCAIAVGFTMAAFVGLGMCTGGVGLAILGIATYGASLADLVYQCSHT